MRQLIFKTYTGTKTIKATPMGAGEAKRYGAQITDEVVQNNIGNNGYLVEYPDGYRSWSPEKQFEEAYKVSETHIDCMRIELANLKENIVKATKEFYSYDMSLCQRSKLKSQLDAMHKYAEALYHRISDAEALYHRISEALNASVTPKITDYEK